MSWRKTLRQHQPAGTLLHGRCRERSRRRRERDYPRRWLERTSRVEGHTKNGGQDEEETNDGAEARFAGMWRRQATRSSATYHVEDVPTIASDPDERAEPRGTREVVVQSGQSMTHLKETTSSLGPDEILEPVTRGIPSPPDALPSSTPITAWSRTKSVIGKDVPRRCASRSSPSQSRHPGYAPEVFTWTNLRHQHHRPHCDERRRSIQSQFVEN